MHRSSHGRATPVAAWVVASIACHSAQPATVPAANARAVSGAEGEAVPDKAGEMGRSGAPIRATPETIDASRYRDLFVASFTRLVRGREVETLSTGEFPNAVVPHTVLVLKRIGQAESYVVTTIGLGRISHSERAAAYVELVAYVDQFGPNIARILSSLGSMMHSKARGGAPWRDYDTVQLPSVEFGLQYFDLRSAGEIEISPTLRVTLLKVIPLSAEEYGRAQDNPSGEYDDPNLAARMAQRWRRALEQR